MSGSDQGHDQGARAFFADSEETQAASSHVALLVASPIGRVIGNFVVSRNNPKVTTRAFTSEQKAIEWLEQQLPGARATRVRAATDAG